MGCHGGYRIDPSGSRIGLGASLKYPRAASGVIHSGLSNLLKKCRNWTTSTSMPTALATSLLVGFFQEGIECSESWCGGSRERFKHAFKCSKIFLHFF